MNKLVVAMELWSHVIDRGRVERNKITTIVISTVVKIHSGRNILRCIHIDTPGIQCLSSIGRSSLGIERAEMAGAYLGMAAPDRICNWSQGIYDGEDPDGDFLLFQRLWR